LAVTIEQLFRRGARERSRPIRNERELELYREKLGPMPQYARLSTIDKAIAAVTFELQMVEWGSDDYKHCMRIASMLRSVREQVGRL
jgi:hypothetical protein